MPVKDKPCPFCGNQYLDEIVTINRHVRCGAVGCPIRWQAMSPAQWNKRADIKEEKILQHTTGTIQN